MLYIAFYDMVGNKMKKAWQLFSHRSYGDNLLPIKLTSALYCKKLYSKEMMGLFFLTINITGKL